MDRLVKYKANYISYHGFGDDYSWTEKGYVMVKNFNEKTKDEIYQLLKEYLGEKDIHSLKYKVIDIIG